MKQEKKLVAFPDDVDRIVDRLVSHPDEVESLKEELRRKISSAEIAKKPCNYKAPGSDSEDPWDNMPV